LPVTFLLCGGLLLCSILVPLVVLVLGFANTVLMGPKPGEILQQCDLARAAESQEDFESAEALYKLALTGKLRQDGATWLGLGNLFQKLHRPEECAKAWGRALDGELEYQTHLTTAYRLAGLLEEELGQPKKAQSVLQQAMARYPDSSLAGAFRDKIQDLEGKVTTATRDMKTG
jgi:tetratricopeptide (TPR) repeat protein